MTWLGTTILSTGRPDIAAARGLAPAARMRRPFTALRKKTNSMAPSSSATASDGETRPARRTLPKALTSAAGR